MPDAQLAGFIDKSIDSAVRFVAGSDRVKLIPEPGDLPQRYVLEFHCDGLVQNPDGKISVAHRFLVGVWFPDDYLRGKPNVFKVLTLLAPNTVFHPNAAPPFLCLGDMRQGTDLTSIICQSFEILTYQKFALQDGLNPAACEWARNQPASRFPIDKRPLRTRAAIEIEAVERGRS
jgi:hypothetical protein